MRHILTSTIMRSIIMRPLPVVCHVHDVDRDEKKEHLWEIMVAKPHTHALSCKHTNN